MKRVLRSSLMGSTAVTDFNTTFTADDIVSLLSQIDELKSHEVFLSKSRDGNVVFVVGNNAYHLMHEDRIREV